MKKKDKYYIGDWCLRCEIFIPDKLGNKIRPMLCSKCSKEIKILLEEMNKDGIYLTSKDNK